MVYEVEDLRRDDCVVTCFKKVCTNNSLLRMNCFVTQFEFSRRGDTDEDVGVKDQLHDQEATLS